MGWFWDSNANEPTNDSYKKLDPALRDFLDKESPLKYEDVKRRETPSNARPSASSPPSTDAAPNTYRSQLGISTIGAEQDQSATVPPENRPAVPAESLFQDGRYAHLWKNYRPQAEIEAAGRSDQDRLADVVEAYNDRKAEIGRAAIENCVDYQLAAKECFSNGGWAKKMTMCREENRAFNRCYTMQGRFLKALGYLAQQRSAEEEERIQMHADKLYHEMLERERIAKEAQEQGLEAPEMPPLIQAEATTQALGQDSAWARARQKAAERGIPQTLSSYPPEKQEEIKRRIEGLPQDQKDLELQLIAAETRAQLEYAEQVTERLEEERVHRAQRRERGKETAGDAIKRMWGWDK
ncbi:hypothetical protein CLAFUW4_02037 [Fulvia fulva]|uniref:Autophagy-related protein 6 n=1 Tax=Passalora fulva TaxID=5499 RepID=A0A9Q8L5K0_PASFU|nr:uncharacterized protein CLAFUR5_02031 [Fulvia fulva]KAK4634647.1 hypothetical protein CLAFUR4_02033 [Fulvia fulva]KAK4636698.1 hypothetical protein CLAFUR0_02036 [Fulvia fulva]UJO11290.1 hypothetical protein CLAFUR5_02031 [Fulvia fulva]WPV09379.1 hypothetical protein CLAFUW4_02037 [Fulvia fulva]WPV23364.1 hypothetical protein CLAFUW7_02037 [Fulvia fulva]